jgi:hypothetical protein
MKLSKISILIVFLLIKSTFFAFANNFPKTSYYVEAGSYGTKRETEPPSYVRELGNIGFKGLEQINWLDLGLDYRTRFELRHNDLRRPRLTTDYPFLLRARTYIGIKNIVDPFRFAIEIHDAQRVNGKFNPDNREVNRLEFIQAYAELHFKDAFGIDDLGNARPIYMRYGRQTFEFTDRRLIASNPWRNTPNNFLGLRTTLGQEKNDWQLDLLALKPIDRLMNDGDKPDQSRDFLAAIGHWRKWAGALTIEPYYLALNERPDASNDYAEQSIYSPGIRLYGWFDKHINYDLTYTQQFGNSNGLSHQAFAVTAELGYTFQEWQSKPRISVFYGQISGDKNPNDQINNRFERFYGFARHWSGDDYIIPENIITPKIQLEFEPIKGLKVDGNYSYYWLDSSTDRFNNLLGGTNNRDETGHSGTFLGQGLELRLRFKPKKFIESTIGYLQFTNGEFVKNRQEATLGEIALNSNFFYIELMFNVFDTVKI